MAERVQKTGVLLILLAVTSIDFIAAQLMKATDESLACNIWARDIVKLPLLDLARNRSGRMVFAASSISSTADIAKICRALRCR